MTNCKLKTNHFGHNGYLNCVTVSPDGSLCASGGKVGSIARGDREREGGGGGERERERAKTW